MFPWRYIPRTWRLLVHHVSRTPGPRSLTPTLVTYSLQILVSQETFIRFLCLQVSMVQSYYVLKGIMPRYYVPRTLFFHYSHLRILHFQGTTFFIVGIFRRTDLRTWGLTLHSVPRVLSSKGDKFQVPYIPSVCLQQHFIIYYTILPL